MCIHTKGIDLTFQITPVLFSLEIYEISIL